MTRSWRNLKVWEKAHELVLSIYSLTTRFPKTETYALSDQIKRAAYSVPANIVEGQSRNTTREYLSFLFNARGSLEELRYFLLLARDLEYIAKEDYQKLENRCAEISIMLNGLIKSLKNRC